MSKNILKNGSAARGINEFEYDIFSKVDKGSKVYRFQVIEETVDSNSKDKTSSHQNNNSQHTSDLDLSSGKSTEPAEPVEIFHIDQDNFNKEIASAKAVSFTEGYEKGLQEGYTKGKAEIEAVANKNYEAEKNDYLKLLKDNFDYVKQELGKIAATVDYLEHESPALVLMFIKDIIGIERKLNDALIISTIKKSFDKFKEMEELTFVIHPSDSDLVREEFLGYPVIEDQNILRGSFKIKSKIGEVDFTIEAVLAELEKTVYEEIGDS